MKHFPYCPNEECKYHRNAPNNASWYKHHGSYRTRINGKQPRYICKKCSRTFASRTFSLDYYAKRKISYPDLLSLQLSNSSINNMARQLNCTTETVHNRLRRINGQL